MVYAGETLAQVFDELHLLPDFDYVKNNPDSDVEFAHRKLKAGDIYSLDNRTNHDEVIDATFRVAGLQPEFWRAETATTMPASFKIVEGRTTVPVRLEAWGTIFVVFRKPTSETSHILPHVTETKVATLTGSWKLAFQPGRGAPDSITMNDLSDWSTNSDPGVKYFSGIGTYTTTFQGSPDWFNKGTRLWIDLGEVRNLADVAINGTSLGQIWHAPYRLDVTSTLTPGMNELTIKVVNAWVNRLIGDEQPGATKITFADVKPYKANSPLLPSGLLGPVTVIREDAH